MKSKRMYRREFESKRNGNWKMIFGLITKIVWFLCIKSIHAEREEVIDTRSGDGR